MTDDKFNKFVDELEKEIIKKDIEDHNEYIVNLFRNPQNWGKPSKEKFNYFQVCRGYHRELFHLYLKISKEGIIEDTHFLTDGCGCMISTGSQITTMIKYKSLDFAENLKISDLDKALKGLPEHEMHCADLAVKTLKSLIINYKKSLK